MIHVAPALAMYAPRLGSGGWDLNLQNNHGKFQKESTASSITTPQASPGAAVLSPRPFALLPLTRPLDGPSNPFFQLAFLVPSFKLQNCPLALSLNVGRWTKIAVKPLSY